MDGSTYIVTGPGSASTSGALIIPKYYNGKLVTGIDAAAFEYKNYTSVTIPDSINNIDGRAFDGCKQLKGVYISSISAWCNIDFFSDSPLYYAGNLYLNGNLVTELVIPHGITSIKQSAFYGCSNLTKIVIPDGVTSIGDSAFSNCSKLTNITLGENVTYIGNGAFSRCDSVIFKNPENWYVVVQADVVASSGTPVSSKKLSDPAKAAELLTQSTYCSKNWNVRSK